MIRSRPSFRGDWGPRPPIPPTFPSGREASTAAISFRPVRADGSRAESSRKPHNSENRINRLSRERLPMMERHFADWSEVYE